MGVQLVGSREKIFSSLKMGKIKEIIKGVNRRFLLELGKYNTIAFTPGKTNH